MSGLYFTEFLLQYNLEIDNYALIRRIIKLILAVQQGGGE